MEIDERREQLTEKIDGLEGKAAEILEKLEQGNVDGAEDLKAEVASIRETLDPLVAEKKELDQKAVISALEDEVRDLHARIGEARKPGRLPFAQHEGSTEEATYGPEGKSSFYADIKAITHGGSSVARKRLDTEYEGKAMREGVDKEGGFLVPPDVSSDLIRLRYYNSVVRPLLSSVRVTTDEFQIPSQVSGLTAGWVAELAEKPSADMEFASQTVNVFTAAGLAVVSNQLLADANWSIDQLVNRDLAFRLAQLEEVAFINGSGTGQPKGILNTSGVGTTTVNTEKVTALLDGIVEAITEVYTEYKGPPNAILMHPRTWQYIATAREETSPSTYLVGTGGSAWGRRANDPIPGYSGTYPPTGELFGLPVYTTPNIPTNLGEGEDESRVIVGDFRTGLILDREDVQYASSEHVYFTTNKTVFRAESRLGFTAGRYPTSFNVVGGKALKGH